MTRKRTLVRPEKLPPLFPADTGRRHDVAALGECMVRLSPPGHDRIGQARSFDVGVGGGEYNVAHACARLGMRAAFVSRLPANPLAEIVLDHARAAGVDVRHVSSAHHDGVGRRDRVGLYFAEIGAGVRGGMALFDRGHSAASAMGPEHLDSDRLFRAEGVRCLHTGGVFAVLSEDTRLTMRAAIAAARAAGTTVGYDLNFRPALADSRTAAAINREFVASADILFGGAEGFRALAGTASPAALARIFPNLRVVAGMERRVHSAGRHDISGFLWTAGRLHRTRGTRSVEVVDRVGTGDAFAAGVLHGLMSGEAPGDTLGFALALAALVHTTRGDTSPFGEADVRALLEDGSATMRR